MKKLIVGCGNPDRADDAAGMLVARRLRELGIEATEHDGDMLSLIDEWSACDDVIIVDAMLSGSPAGSVVVLDAHDIAPKHQFRCSTHDFGLAEAIHLARSIGRLPPKLTIYGIEAGNCDAGGAVSNEIAQAVERVAQDILTSSRGMHALG